MKNSTKRLPAAALSMVLGFSLTACGDGETNTAPVANAGPDRTVTTGDSVTLDGSASSDANGNALTYSWSFAYKPAGSTASLSNPNLPNPTFTADKKGAYVLSLTVSDGAASSTDTVTITAKEWGTAQLIETGAGSAEFPQIAFDGSGNAIAVWHQIDGTDWSIFANRYD